MYRHIGAVDRRVVDSFIPRIHALALGTRVFTIFAQEYKGKEEKENPKKSGEEGQKKETCIFGKKAPPTMKGDCESFKCRESADVLASEEKGP